MIDRFYEMLTKLGITKYQDKVLHALVGFIAGIISHAVFSGSLLMIVPVIALAVGKELYDELIQDTFFDFRDMSVTLFGGFVGILIYGLFIG